MEVIQLVRDVEQHRVGEQPDGVDGARDDLLGATAEGADSVQFFGEMSTRPSLCNDRCMVQAVQKTAESRSCSLLVSSSSWTTLLTCPLLCTSGVMVQTAARGGPTVAVPGQGFCLARCGARQVLLF